jgi:PST family polysaccharide transporter
MGWIEAWVAVPSIVPVMRLMLVAVAFQLLAVPATARLERALNYGSVAWAEIFGTVAFYAVAIPLALTGYGVLSLAAGWVCQQVLTCILAHVWARQWPIFRWSSAEAGQIMRYSFTFSVATWIWQLRMLVNPLIVGHFLGAAAVGIIGMTSGLLDMLGIFKTISWRLSIVAFGRIQSNRDKLRDAVNQGMQLQILAVGSVMLGFAWLGQFVIPILFGPRWLPVMTIYPYLALGYVVNAQFNMQASALSVLGRNGAITIFNLVHVVIFATAATIFIPYAGMLGYGWAEVAALASYVVLHALTVRTIGRLSYRVAAIWLAGVAIGLFWRQTTPLAIAAPFVALLAPPSIAQLRLFYSMIWSRGGGVVAAR